MPRREIDLQGRTAADSDGLPQVAPVNQAVIYYDGTANVIKSSVNGRAYEDLSEVGGEARAVEFEDFNGQTVLREYLVPMFSSNDGTNVITTGDTHVISGLFRIGKAGVIGGLAIVGATTLATSDTNFLTFAATNKVGDGSGTTSIIAGGNAATTKATGGSALTAYVSRSIALSATTLNLAVASSDIIEFTATVSGTLANSVLRPYARLQILEVPERIGARVTRTTSLLSPLVVPVTSAAGNGEVLLQLNAGSGTNQGRIDWQNRLDCFIRNKAVFSCRLKVSGTSTNNVLVWGFCSNDPGAINPDIATHNAWFRIEGNSLALLAETDDNTTDTDDQAVGLTLTADTYYTFEIDCSTLSNILFTVRNDAGVVLASKSGLSLAAIPAGTRVQPSVMIGKTTGTQTDSITVDWWRTKWSRS